ncbi:extracellular solute-binding protein [Mesorhizobium sp. M1227]
MDANGKRGNDPTFDKSNVKTYGFLSTGDGFGQDTWSAFAASAGFKYIDQPFGKHFQYDSPALAKTLTYLRDLALVKGVGVSKAQAGGLNPSGLFVSGKVAMAPQGSWMIASLKGTAPGPFGLAPMPAGPEGRRSMMNGLADSISATSEHQAEAWKWVKYLGSAACQDVVGQSGVVFPALPSGTEAAIKAHQASGLDLYRCCQAGDYLRVPAQRLRQPDIHNLPDRRRQDQFGRGRSG